MVSIFCSIDQFVIKPIPFLENSVIQDIRPQVLSFSFKRFFTTNDMMYLERSRARENFNEPSSVLRVAGLKMTVAVFF